MEVYMPWTTYLLALKCRRCWLAAWYHQSMLTVTANRNLMKGEFRGSALIAVMIDKSCVKTPTNILAVSVIDTLTLMLQVANLASTKWCKKPWKWQKPWHMGMHLGVLSESFPMNTNMTGLRWFWRNPCGLLLWTKVASALEGLTLSSDSSTACRAYTEKFRKNTQFPLLLFLIESLGIWDDSAQIAGTVLECISTLSMLRRLLSKAQERRNSWKSCHVGIHWIALDECYQMSTHMPGFQSFFRFLHHFEFAKLATS